MTYDHMMFGIILLMWFHFIADFVLQCDRVAIGKSKSNLVLLEHVLTYILPFALLPVPWQFLVVNGVLHFMTDFCTSRMTSYLWQKNLRHWFFVTIGFDQAIHMTCLVATYFWMIQQ